MVCCALASLNSSHTHSGPLLADPLSIWYRWRLSARQWQDVEDYTRELEGKVVAVIGAALRDLQPARLSFGHGAANFGVNRRRKAEKSGAVSFVPNPQGPVDPDVAVRSGAVASIELSDIMKPTKTLTVILGN